MSQHEMLKTLYPVIAGTPEYRDPNLKPYEVAALIIKRQQLLIEELRRDVARLSATSAGGETRWIEFQP